MNNAKYFIDKYNLKGLEGNEELFEEFIEYLRVFSRYTCPEHFYRAWKILVLQTSDKDCQVNKILNAALNLYLDLQEKDEAIQLHHLQFKLKNKELSKEEVEKLVILEVKREKRRSGELYDALWSEKFDKLKKNFERSFVKSYIMLVQTLLDLDMEKINPESNLYKRILFNIKFIEKELESLGIETIGKRGEVTKFNKNQHYCVEEIPEGSEVVVIIPGFPDLGKAFVKKK